PGYRDDGKDRGDRAERDGDGEVAGQSPGLHGASSAGRSARPGPARFRCAWRGPARGARVLPVVPTDRLTPPRAGERGAAPVDGEPWQDPLPRHDAASDSKRSTVSLAPRTVLLCQVCHAEDFPAGHIARTIPAETDGPVILDTRLVA